MPVSVPATVPLPVFPVAASLIVSVPESESPACVSFQVIVPGPVESDADPLHVPVRLSCAGSGDGEAGALQVAKTASPPTNVAVVLRRRVSIVTVQSEQGRCRRKDSARAVFATDIDDISCTTTKVRSQASRFH